jgi:hypothetical protein
VEVCHRGIWGSICSNTWNLSDAHILCKHLEFESEGVEIRNVFGSRGSVIPSDIKCAETEEELQSCSMSWNNDCESNISAGVICLKDFDHTGRCLDEDGTPPPDQRKVMEMER